TVYTSASATPREWKPRDSSRLLLLWPVVVLGVLGAAREQKLWYAMAVFPALALLSARALGRWLAPERARSNAVLGGFALAAAAGAVLALTPLRLPPPRPPAAAAPARRPSAGRGGAHADGAGGHDPVRGRELLLGRAPVRVLQRPAAAAREHGSRGRARGAGAWPLGLGRERPLRERQRGRR